MPAALEQGRVIDDPVLNGAALLHRRHDPTEHPLPQGPSFQLASLTKCWIDWCRRETFPLSRRSAIGSMLLRSPGSSSPVMESLSPRRRASLPTTVPR